MTKALIALVAAGLMTACLDATTGAADGAEQPAQDAAGDTSAELVCKGAPGELLWTFEADGEVLGTPAVAADGTIFFATMNATVYALDCGGNVRWSWRHDCEGDHCARGFASSPVIGSALNRGLVYVRDNRSIRNKYLFALTLGGELGWTYETQSALATLDASPALGSDGAVWTPMTGGSVGINGGLVRLDGGIGETTHGFPIAFGGVHGSPITVGGSLHAGTIHRPNWDLAAPQVATYWRITSEGFAAAMDAERIEEAATADTLLTMSGLARAPNGLTALTTTVEPPTGGPETFLHLLSADGGLHDRIRLFVAGSRVVGSPIVRERAGEQRGYEIILALADGNLHVVGIPGDPDEGLKLRALGEGLSELAGAPALGDDGRVYATAMVGDEVVLQGLPLDEGLEPTQTVLGTRGGTGRVTTSVQMAIGGVAYVGTRNGHVQAVQTHATGLDPDSPWPSYRHDPRNSGLADH